MMATKYRLLLQMALDDNDEWDTVTGRIFESDMTEEDLDARIRKLESEVSK